jgi:hypothetical protein
MWSLKMTTHYSLNLDPARRQADERHFQRCHEAAVRCQVAHNQAQRKHAAHHGAPANEHATYDRKLRAAGEAKHATIMASEAQRQSDLAAISTAEHESSHFTHRKFAYQHLHELGLAGEVVQIRT